MRRTRLLAATLVGLALTAAACGSDGSSTADSAARTVQVRMQDNEFVPDSVAVRAGETVRFVFVNAGTVTHDAFIGDAAAQRDHEQEADDMGGHAMGGDDDAISVAPGKTGTLTHTFHAGDQVLVGCHEPGHYAAGMKLAIDVT